MGMIERNLIEATSLASAGTLSSGAQRGAREAWGMGKSRFSASAQDSQRVSGEDGGRWSANGVCQNLGKAHHSLRRGRDIIDADAGIRPVRSRGERVAGRCSSCGTVGIIPAMRRGRKGRCPRDVFPLRLDHRFGHRAMMRTVAAAACGQACILACPKDRGQGA